MIPHLAGFQPAGRRRIRGLPNPGADGGFPSRHPLVAPCSGSPGGLIRSGPQALGRVALRPGGTLGQDGSWGSVMLTATAASVLRLRSRPLSHVWAREAGAALHFGEAAVTLHFHSSCSWRQYGIAQIFRSSLSWSSADHGKQARGLQTSLSGPTDSLSLLLPLLPCGPMSHLNFFFISFSEMKMMVRGSLRVVGGGVGETHG